MLIDIVVIGLLILFLYSFRTADRYYEHATKLAEFEHQRRHLLADKFLKLGLKINEIRNNTRMDVMELQKAFDELQELSLRYETISQKACDESFAYHQAQQSGFNKISM